MSEFWKNKIKAFLHDPPDKALILFHKSHESKRDEILDRLNLRYDERLDIADHIASAMQRLDIPKDYRMDDARGCNAHICFKGALKPIFKHTLSGDLEKLKEIKSFIATWSYEKALDEYSFDPKIVKEFLDENDWKKTYFLLWRFLPEKYPHGYILPADTRIPDHSIWDHLDVTAAISSCLGDIGLFALKITAVQEFISHSRKLSDLWASSHIFSTIVFAGIKVIADELGPDVIIYPQLRGNPMIDLAEFKGESGTFVLYNEGQRLNVLKEDPKEKLHIANFPNTFLSFIPASIASDIAKKVGNEIKEKWKEIANEARKLLNESNIQVDESLWNNQIENTIEITLTWLKFFNFDNFNNVKESIPSDLSEKQEKWLDFTEDSKSYRGLKVERHGLSRYKIYDGGIEKIEITASNKEMFVDTYNKVFDSEKAEILKSLHEWLHRDSSHFYYITCELLGTALVQKSRLWDAWEEEPITNKKCLMCGRRNALLLRDEDGSYKIWKENGWSEVSPRETFEHLLKEEERLCAVCLIKRLYGNVFSKFFKGVGLPSWESVVEIAAKDFIEKTKHAKVYEEIKRRDVELIYKHEWDSKDKIKLKRINELGGKNGEIYKELNKLWEIYGTPRRYYAILMMDGDRIGKMLSGETLPNFGEFLHSAFRNKIKGWKENGKKKGEELTKTKRILTPSYHIAISRAMKDFSLYKVSEIVEKFDGFLIYAGGDDVLALFPADKVLDAAKEIQEYFKMDFYEVEANGRKRKVMGLGNKASMSAGIVFVHYKWPLYDAVEKVREAVKNAKDKYRRNAFCVTFIKRSGEILTTGGKWDFVSNLTSIGKAIVNRKISHRFIYDFIEVSEVLKGDMLKAEVKRLLKRRREETNDEEIKEIQGKLCCLIEKYDAQGLKPRELGNALKIIYDAYRGEAE